MSLMNVLNDFPYRARYYVRRPWRWFQELWWNLQAAWARATKGHAWRDSAEMDEYLLHLIPSMLRDHAKSIAYPGNDEFPTYESWQAWCNSLANRFEAVQEENWSGRNEWEHQWHNMNSMSWRYPNLTTTYTFIKEDIEEVREKYLAREQELYNEREQIIQQLYMELAKHHSMLWIQEEKEYVSK